MRIETVFARLRERGLTYEQIRKLTIHQVQAIENHERNEHGDISPRYVDDGPTTLSPEELHFAVWKRRGLSEREAAVKWRETLEVEARRTALASAETDGDKLDAAIWELRREQMRRRRFWGRLDE